MTVLHHDDYQEQNAGLSTWLKKHLVGIKRMQYAFIIIACTTILAFQVAKCTEKYMDKNTARTAVQVTMSKTATFPELTICPTYKLNVSQWISNDTTKDPSDVQEVVKTVTLYVEEGIKGQNIIKLTPNDTICQGQSIFHPKDGDCFATKLPDCIIDAGPFQLDFDFFNMTGAVDIFIQHIDQGNFVMIGINHEVVQLLSIKMTREYVLYTILSIVAEKGGYVAVGFLLASIAQLNAWILNRVCCLSKKEAEVRRRKKKQYQVPPASSRTIDGEHFVAVQ